MHSRQLGRLGTAALIALGAARLRQVGRRDPPPPPPSVEPATNLSPTTPAAKGDTGAVTWATYREVGTLDPIQAFDYPENTVISSMCDSLLQQQPDGTTKPGLASKVDTPDDRTIVFTINTRREVLGRQERHARGRRLQPPAQHEPEARRLLRPRLRRTSSRSTATGADQVTIKLSKPDNWLQGELSQMPGIVLEKAYVEAKGKAFGTPSRRHDVHRRRSSSTSWKPGSVADGRAQRRLLGHGAQAQGEVDGLQGRARRLQPHLRAC